MTKIASGIVGLLLLALMPAKAATLSVGSFFAPAITSGADTNLSVTNAFYVPANGTTNLATNCYAPVVVSGNSGLAVTVDLVATNAAGQTNNGFMYFVFGLSTDGVTYTTASNAFHVAVPVLGSTRVVWATNVTASVTENFAYARLQTIAHTNLGNYFVTNLAYRFRRNE